jgi:hypothetical protein
MTRAGSTLGAFFALRLLLVLGFRFPAASRLLAVAVHFPPLLLARRRIFPLLLARRARVRARAFKRGAGVRTCLRTRK